MTTGVRERLPSPMAVDAVVFNDAAARTLFVRLGDAAGGHARSLWRQGWQRLRQAEESGWAGASTVWASAPGSYQVAHVLPAEGGQLKVHFPVGVGDGVYAKLVSQPGLSAIVVLDRSACTILSVKFLNRP